MLNRVFRKETRVVIEKDGIPVAAVISVQDLEWFDRMEAQRQERWEVIDELHALNRDKDPEDVERDVAAALVEVRAEQRAKQKAAKKA